MTGVGDATDDLEKHVVGESEETGLRCGQGGWGGGGVRDGESGGGGGEGVIVVFLGDG